MFDYMGVSRSRSLCSFRGGGGGYNDSEDGDLTHSHARTSGVTGALPFDSSLILSSFGFLSPEWFLGFGFQEDFRLLLAMATADAYRVGGGLRMNSSSLWRNSRAEIFSQSSRDEDDKEALKWAALEKLPTYNRLRKGLHNLELEERKNLVERLVKIAEEDNEKFLLKLRNRIDSNLNGVESITYKGIRSVPSIKQWDSLSTEKKEFRASTIMEAFFFLVLFSVSGFSSIVAGEETPLKTYIVRVNPPAGDVHALSRDLEAWHRSFLPASTASVSQKRFLYSYRHVLSGFAARLTEEEVQAMRKKDGFVSASPSKTYHLHTTRTPGFLGLYNTSGFWRRSNYGEGVIIGLLDTGVYPKHPSFSDEGMSPPPAKWTGGCEFNGTACNNKLIGAKNFDSMTTGTAPFDNEGHGTHTASTAAGNYVKHANGNGLARGTAVGIAPRAHVAMYKVCGVFGCDGGDILAGYDAAISDGVDVLSVSIGGESSPFYDDPIAQGSFAAIRKGIFVSCSAGNSGPNHSTVTNEAPWILTVAASTLDRTISATAKLGSMEEFDGQSLNQPKNFSHKLLPLVFPGANNITAAYCGAGSLEASNVKGKVVVCDRGGEVGRSDKGVEVKSAGGAAMILANNEENGFSIVADPHILPATHVSYADGLRIKAYINSTSEPTATILFKGTIIRVPSAPEITSFSSRGPSLATPGILKPDITGPGVGILAAWPSDMLNVTRGADSFQMLSGTSMSCPHLSGVAALLKSAHPTWSPAAIKSAILTTADTVNRQDQPILDEKHVPADLFALGAGLVNPSKASDPGLVYDNEPYDYIPYLCGLGYTDEQVGGILLRKINCSKVSSIPEAQLNYPSFSIGLGSKAVKLERTVTNVAKPTTYTVVVNPPPGVEVIVEPVKIRFKELNEKQKYSVTFRKIGLTDSKQPFAEGFLKWVSGRHTVRSPISVTFK